MKFYSYVSWLEKEHPSSLELLCFVHNNGSDRRVTRCVKRTRLKVRLRRPTNGRDTTNERFVSSEKDSLSLFAAISKYIVRYSSKRASFRQFVTFFTNRHRSRGWRKILSKQSYRYNFAIRARKEIIDFRSEFCKKKKKIRCTRETMLVRDSIRIRSSPVPENLFHSMEPSYNGAPFIPRSFIKTKFYHRVERALDRYYYSNEK